MVPEEHIKKAYTVAYAAYRLADALANPAIRQALENHGLRALLAGLEGDTKATASSLTALEYAIGFGRDTGHIHPQSAELVLAELYELKGSLPREQESKNKKEPELLSREDLFPKKQKPGVAVAKKPIEQREEKLEGINVWNDAESFQMSIDLTDAAIDNPAIAELESGPTIIPHAIKESHVVVQNNDEGFSSRKERIVERIRQSGNCRMRDIQEVLNGTSERTLRYDLQRLVGEGIIERIGNGGPATYYRIKTTGHG